MFFVEHCRFLGGKTVKTPRFGPTPANAEIQQNEGKRTASSVTGESHRKLLKRFRANAAGDRSGGGLREGQETDEPGQVGMLE